MLSFWLSSSSRCGEGSEAGEIGHEPDVVGLTQVAKKKYKKKEGLMLLGSLVASARTKACHSTN